MKTTTQFGHIVAATLFVAASVSAQTLKWAYTNSNAYQILGSAGDGRGGFVVIEFCTTSIYSGRILWFAPEGELQLAHSFEQPSENGYMDIVRLTPRELAVRFWPRVGEGEPPKNLLRRFKKSGSRITIVDKELALDETMPRVPDKMTDEFGFFTFVNDQVRRYSN